MPTIMPAVFFRPPPIPHRPLDALEQMLGRYLVSAWPWPDIEPGRPGLNVPRPYGGAAVDRPA